MAPENRHEAGDDHAGGHGFGADAFDRAMINRIAQIAGIIKCPLLLPLGISQIEIKQHHHAGLGIESRQGNDTHPHGDAQIVVAQVDRPKRTHQ